MSDEVNSMMVRLTGDGTSYQKMLMESQQATERTASSVEAATKRIEGMQHSLHSFAGGAVSILGGLGLATSLNSAFEAFEKFESGQIRLRNSIEASGRAADVTIGSYKAFADQVVDATTTSKGEVFALIEQAERMQITGDAAQRLVTNAIALGAATGKSAQEGFRAARAMEMGNMQQLRFALGLRGVTDEAKIQAIAQQMLTSGWKTANEQAETAGGQIEKLKRTFKGLTIEVGGVIAETIQPVIKWFSEMMETFKRLTPESKKMVVMFAGIVLGILAIGPAISTLTYLLGPMAAAFGFVASAAGFILTPLGLVTATVIGIGAYLTDIGTVVAWFGQQWASLKAYIQPAIDGIKAAFAAGDVKLAVQIMWAQIKLSFSEAIGPLKEQWIGFTSALAAAWFEMTAKIQGQFAKTSTDVQNIMTWLRYQTGQITFEQGQAEIERLGGALNARLNEIEKERKAAVDVIQAQTAKDIQAARDALKGLEKDRDDLVQKAKDEAAKVPPKVPLALDPKMPKLPTQTAHVKMKFDAAAFASAEAKGRIEEFMDRIQHPEDYKKGHGGHGGAAGGKFEAAGARNVEAAARQERQVELLDRIAQGVDGLNGKPVMPVVPADIA